MKQKLLNKLWLRVGMIVAIMTTALAGTAAATDVTISFGSGTDCWAANNSVTYTDSDGRVWTRTCAVSNMSGQSGYSQFGNSSNTCTSLTFTATAGSDMTVTAFSVKMAGASGGNSPTTGTIYLYKRTSEGTETQLATASVSGTPSVTCAISSSQAFSSTDILKVSYVGTAKAIRVTELSYSYTTAGGSTLDDSDFALTDASLDLTFDLYPSATPQTLHYSTSSTGTVTIADNAYATFSVDQVNKTITVTPKAVTTSAQTIVVNQAADDTYAAGSDEFTISISDSAPSCNVTYKPNGANEGENDRPVTPAPHAGDNVTVAANPFKYDGHFFTKWNTEADGSGDDYFPGDEIQNINANIDLYAQWEAFTYDFTQIDMSTGWGSYAAHTITYGDATVTLASASKQSGTITDQPVTKGGDVTLVMTDGSSLSKVTFVCAQWGTKEQTITLHYSTDGGTTYGNFAPAVTSDNFFITKDNLPAGTNAVKITFSSQSNQVGITGVSIEKYVDNRDNAGIAFSVPALTFTEGDTYTAPTFSNPNNVEVTFTTTNSSVASWNNGLVCGGSTGTATITATFEGDTNYKPATATLVVTINEDLGFATVKVGSGVYQKITSTSELEAGKRYLIVYYDGVSDEAEVFAGISSNIGQRVELSIAEDKINNNVASPATPVVLQNAGSGNWYIMDGSDFLYWSSGNNLYSSTEVSQTGNSWTIDEDGSAMYIQNATTTGRYLQYNTGSPRFACYTHTQKDVVLYKELPVTLNSEGYATFASTSAVDFSDDSEFSAWKITSVSATSINFEQISGTVAAGTGVLLKGAANAELTFVKAESGADISSTNKLVGFPTGGTIAEDASYYGLKGTQFVKVKAGTVKAGKALLPANVVNGTEVKALTFVFEEDDPTDINAIENGELTIDNEIYNVAGQRLSKMQKGINIVNGKKILK